MQQVLESGRMCAPHLLERGVDPDSAWRRNEPLPIKHGPLLFDFRWLPKPQLVPSEAEQAAAAGGAVVHRSAAEAPLVASVVAGKKRKAAEEPASNNTLI